MLMSKLFAVVTAGDQNLGFPFEKLIRIDPSSKFFYCFETKWWYLCTGFRFSQKF